MLFPFRLVSDTYLRRWRVFDPQTSGGLLFAVPEDEAERMLKAFEQADLGTKVSVVGRVLESGVDKPCIRLCHKVEMR